MIYFLWIFTFFKAKFVISIVSFISITLIARVLIFLSTFLVKVQLIACHVCRSMSKFFFFADFDQFLFVARILSWISFNLHIKRNLTNLRNDFISIFNGLVNNEIPSFATAYANFFSKPLHFSNKLFLHQIDAQG